MSNRKLTILGVIAALTVIWAIMQSRITNRPRSEITVPRYLIEGLDPDRIASIVIGTGKNQVILNRRGKGFIVASKDNYPAVNTELNQLINNCLDAQPGEFITDEPKNFKDLGVTEENARYVVKFFKADSSLLTGIIVGKLREKGRGTYIRRVDSNDVYISPKTPWIKKRSLDYIKQDLAAVKRQDIQSVTVSGPNEIYTLDAADDGKTALLPDLPEGKKLKTSTANSVLTALTSLRFDDVRKFSAKDNKLKFDNRYTCRLKDSTLYTVKLAKNGEKYYALCTAEFTDKTPVTKKKGEVESDEELKKKEAKLLARDNAEDFEKTHAGWLYEIPKYRAENMTKKLADLLEDIPKPKPKAESGEKTTPTEKTTKPPAEVNEKAAQKQPQPPPKKAKAPADANSPQKPQ